LRRAGHEDGETADQCEKNQFSRAHRSSA
jgi:hypothetical protein